MIRTLDIAGESGPSAEGEDPGGDDALPGFQTLGYGSSGEDASAREQDNRVRFLGQMGIAVRPLVRRGLQMLALYDRIRDEYKGLALYDRAVKHDEAVASGETRVYATGAPKVCVRLLGGLIEIRVEAGGVIKVGADEGEVQLAPGAGTYAGQSVARNGDLVNPGVAMVAWMAAVNAAIPMPTPVPPATLGTITGSLSRAKA